MTMDVDVGDESSVAVRLLAKPKLPERLNCGCAGGNGGTPFLFMQWLADSDYEFGWYVEEDVVFTGHWKEIFKLRVMIKPAGSVLRDDGSEMRLPRGSTVGVKQDLVAHITRAASSWKKMCRMPGDVPRGEMRMRTCSVNGARYKTKWPVIGVSRKLARGVMDSIASPYGVNGHQEPIMFPFCERHMRPPCKYTVIPNDLLGVFQLGLSLIHI